jgi:hypothetical protein
VSFTDPDRFAAMTAAETNAQGLKQSGVAPSLLTGTATSNTDEDGTVQVEIDGPDTVTASTEDDPTNEPIYARCVAGYVAQDERVHVLFSGGTAYVIGSGGDGGEGQPRTIGAASIEPQTDVAILGTAQTMVPLLAAESTILHPGHLIEICVNMHLQSGAASNTITGRVIRTDADGVDVEVARFCRESALANNQTIQVGVPVFDFAPEPGTYSYTPSLQASSTGLTIVLDPATSPLVVASCIVKDQGPLPVSYLAS